MSLSILDHHLTVLSNRIGELQTVALGSSRADIGDCKDFLASLEAVAQAATRAGHEMRYHISHLETLDRLRPSRNCPF